MIDDSGLPTPIDTGHRRLSTLDQLADIPEEKSGCRSRRARAPGAPTGSTCSTSCARSAITTPAELRQADHKAVIAWERYMRETEHAASSTIRRRLAALSSLYKHLVRHDHARAQPGRRGRAAGDQSRRRLDRSPSRKRRRANCSTCRPKTRSPGCAIARSCRSACRSGCAAPRSPRSRSAICTRTAAMTSLRVMRKGGRRDALAINPQTAARLRAYLEEAGHGADIDGPLFRPLQAQRQAPRGAPRHGPRRDRSRRAQIRRRARARSRLLGALDARHLHHHGAGKRRAARGRAESRRAPRPGTTKLYDRRGYNPEKAASFFATY